MSVYINQPNHAYVGMFGYASSTARITNLGLENGTVIGDYVTGGLIGYSGGGTTTSCHFTGTVSGHSFVGGLIGYILPGGTIQYCYAEATVIGNNIVGGLLGLNDDSMVTSCYASGTVSGVLTGGLIGQNQGSVSVCYATSSVSGTDNAGGLIGNNMSTVTACYASGAAAGDSIVGGLIGTSSGGTVSASYWDTDASGQATSAAGTGLTSLDMLFEASFTGFDFTTNPDWVIVEGDTRPYLPWQTVNIPFGGVVYAAFDYFGPTNNGLYATPFASLGTAMTYVAPGGLLVLKSGYSTEQLTLTAPMRIDSLSTVQIGETNN